MKFNTFIFCWAHLEGTFGYALQSTEPPEFLLSLHLSCSNGLFVGDYGYWSNPKWLPFEGERNKRLEITTVLFTRSKSNRVILIGCRSLYSFQWIKGEDYYLHQQDAQKEKYQKTSNNIVIQMHCEVNGQKSCDHFIS